MDKTAQRLDDRLIPRRSSGPVSSPMRLMANYIPIEAGEATTPSFFHLISVANTNRPKHCTYSMATNAVDVLKSGFRGGNIA